MPTSPPDLAKEHMQRYCCHVYQVAITEESSSEAFLAAVENQKRPSLLLEPPTIYFVANDPPLPSSEVSEPSPREFQPLRLIKTLLSWCRRILRFEV